MSKTIALRYCGGCNPRYDRSALAERLKVRFPELCYAQSGSSYDLCVLICGCTAACVNVSDLPDTELLYLRSEKEFSAAVEQIKKLWENK